MRAHQKDAYFETSFQTQLQEVLHIFKGSRFINTHPEEIAVAAKAIYLSLTTLIARRTLGEEYVDLIYVNRKGTRFPKILLRIGFILSYAVVPYFLTKLIRRLGLSRSDDEDDDDEDNDEENKSKSFWSMYPKVLDVIMNLHIAIFYFQGEFYSLSKRIFGLRYAFGHNKDPKKLAKSGNYSFLGGLILLQFLVKSILKLKTYNDTQKEKRQSQKRGGDLENSEALLSNFSKFKQLEKVGQAVAKRKDLQIELSDPNQLPYIPEDSRTCMLCLTEMTNPAAANCGHFFCWTCIVDWIREHPECPLCRQLCTELNLLPLR